MANKPTLFCKEDEMLQRATHVIKQFKNQDTPLQNEYERLLKDYKKLFKQTKFLIKMGDRQQNKLTTRTEGLQSSNVELQHKAKEAEEAVRATEKKLAQFLEAASIGVFVMDADARPYYANKKAKEILGKGIVPTSNTEELSEVYQAYLAGTMQLYPTDKLPIVQALKGKVSSVDDMEIHQGGNIIPIEVWGTPIFDEQGNVVYAIATFQEITERRRAEEKLLLTQFSVEHAVEAIFWIASDARILYVNEAAVRSLGYSRQELYAMTVHDIEPNLPVKVWAEHWKKLKQRGCIIYESYHQTKEGIIFPVEIMLNYTLFNDVEYHFSFVRDVTACSKQAEAEQNRFTETLAKLNKAYERFVPHQFLNLLDKKSAIDIHLGDQVEKEMTILFSDIRGFTALSEKMSPQENFNFINAYLSRMEPIIHEHHGVIDKYIGDAIMALFPNNADDAVQAAISMLKELANYNLTSNSKRPSFNIGIGIHTGQLMLGTIGGENRMDGTVISDAVNLASRVESVTKTYGVALLITEYTYLKLLDPLAYHIRVVDTTTVKGKSKEVTIYEVFDAEPPESVILKEKTRDDFEAGFMLYHCEEFYDARSYFEKVLQANSNDKVAQIYLDNCQIILDIIMQEPPKIFIVDDIIGNIYGLEKFLTVHGCRVSMTTDPEMALQLIEKESPDLILLDVIMPNIDGFELCQQIKKKPNLQEIPIIFMTSLSEAMDKVKGFEVGAVDYLTRPIKFIELLARVKTHINIHRLQQFQLKNLELKINNTALKNKIIQLINNTLAVRQGKNGTSWF
jgi:PAS domain S-box-containing protein